MCHPSHQQISLVRERTMSHIAVVQSSSSSRSSVSPSSPLLLDVSKASQTQHVKKKEKDSPSPLQASSLLEFLFQKEPPLAAKAREIEKSLPPLFLTAHIQFLNFYQFDLRNTSQFFPLLSIFPSLDFYNVFITTFLIPSSPSLLSSIYTTVIA